MGVSIPLMHKINFYVYNITFPKWWEVYNEILLLQFPIIFWQRICPF